tara:strand:+ start:2522 stop:2797 length:276 start_codon:yes stop_codon:yes gene_type:complete
MRWVRSIRHKEIILFWIEGTPAKTYAFRTDGKDLYSYETKIGVTMSNGTKVLFDYTSKTGNFINQTTSCHVGLAKKYVDKVVHPHSPITIL